MRLWLRWWQRWFRGREAGKWLVGPQLTGRLLGAGRMSGLLRLPLMLLFRLLTLRILRGWGDGREESGGGG